MAESEAVGVSSNKKTVKKVTKKLDFFSLYEEMEADNPDLVANKLFWSRKGNSQKYTCSLCNISIEMSKNTSLVKTSILGHINDKYHKKRFDAQQTQIKINLIDEHLINETETYSEDDEEIDDDTLQTAPLQLTKGNENTLVNFDTIYASFLKIDPVVKTSKEFIKKHKDGRHYVCTLCKVLIFHSLNPIEFRYNVWVHINDESHRQLLPNFFEVQKGFKKVVNKLSKTVPSDLQNDVKLMEIGPVFRFVRCSVCKIAVSINEHRLLNHINRHDHQERKMLKEKGTEKKESLSNRTCDAFRKLVVRIDEEFRTDLKYIFIGRMLGYIICSLCTYVVLPTQFYLQSHFGSPAHKANKKSFTINKDAKFKVSLQDLLKTLPEDLQGYRMFQENMCGLTCKRCKESFPATSYDLYLHITKDKHVQT